MAEINMEKAREVYNSIVEALEAREWTFDRNDEDLIIKTGIKGEDLPIEFLLIVNPRNEVIQFISRLPYNIPEEKRIDAAVAVCVANYGLVDGSFDYDVRDGEIRYRVTCSYIGSDVPADLVEYIIFIGVKTVDEYNDRLFMLSKGMISVQEFLDQDRGNNN